MTYNTILVSESIGSITVTFNRLSHRNSINAQFVKEINQVLDSAEQNSECKMVVFEGQGGVFCTGMDFQEAAEGLENPNRDDWPFSPQYMATIKRFTLIPKIIISKVDGQVMAGGVGLAAASDLVIATPRSQFNLSEALWGLLPAMVIPYLIRRVGYQKAYSLTLTTLPITAQDAHKIHLVDEVSEEPDKSIQRLWQRLGRLEGSTIGSMKQYFRKMWMINEQMEEIAVSEISRLISHPKVRENIHNFVKYMKFPWENK